MDINHLSKSHSTYLRSHANNPVNWHSWSDEVLEKAKRENKIIIISIGYATCHWCHVMNRESFSDKNVTEIMNQHFINIKVDREERPDVDQVYMQAVHLINKRGGWPLNCFATPDGKPFYGGSYFPRENWAELLNNIQDLWQKEPHKIVAQANQITDYVNELPSQFMQQNTFANFSDAYNTIKEDFLANSDMEYGGPKGAPKFLMPGHLQFLMDSQFFDNDLQSADYVNLSLLKFAQGGIHDHLAGGFSRYSVDAQWKIPHFEKTLYDNAQLISLYTNAYKHFKNPYYKSIAEQTANFALRYLQTKNQLFYSGIDADSEGVEGKFYVWTKKEFTEILGEKADLFIDWFGIDAESLWEKDLNVLTQWKDKKDFLQKHQIDEKDFDFLFQEAKTKLLKYRGKRVPPVVDSNIIVSWNAMMFKSLLEISEVSNNAKYKEVAMDGIETLLAQMWLPSKKVFRTLRANETDAVEGFLEDYVCFAELLITAYLINQKKEYLDIAQEIVEAIMERFSNSSEPLLNFSSKNESALFAQSVELFDNVIPSSNSMAAILFLKLGVIISLPELTNRALRMANAGMYLSGSSPMSSYHWALLFLMIQKEPLSIKLLNIDSDNLPYHPFVYYSIPQKDSSPKKIEICGINRCLEPFSNLKELISYLNEK